MHLKSTQTELRRVTPVRRNSETNVSGQLFTPIRRVQNRVSEQYA